MNQVQHYREKRKLSQKALADLCGCSQPTIAAIEGGGTTNVNLAQLIAAALGEKLEIIFPPAIKTRDSNEPRAANA